MPFECETTASAEEPLLGLSIAVDPMLVGELLLEIGDTVGAEPETYVSSARLNREVTDAAVRLVEAFELTHGQPHPRAADRARDRLPGADQRGRAKVLRLLTAQPNRHGQIARVLRHIHAEYADDLDVGLLAREANMGVSSFHRAFRDATATSPLQYLKSIRLHRARALLDARRRERAGRGPQGRLRERLTVQPRVPADVRL